MLSRDQDEPRVLLDFLESAFLTFSLARFSMVPAKGLYEQYPKETRSLRRGLAEVLVILAGC